jgi:hypothetical protein
MSRFMLALLHGGEREGARILAPETIAGLLPQQAQVHPSSRACTYGLSEITVEGRPAVYQEGNGIGFANRLILLPEARFGGFLSANHRPLTFDASPTQALQFIRDLSTAMMVVYVLTPARLPLALVRSSRRTRSRGSLVHHTSTIQVR